MVAYACFLSNHFQTEELSVARSCEICGKGALTGHKVSHSNKKNNRTFKPNIQSIRALSAHGNHVRMNVCTRCIRSGKVKKIS